MPWPHLLAWGVVSPEPVLRVGAHAEPWCGARSPEGSAPPPHRLLSAWQVNMVIGILVFNKLVSKDGITDKKLKERAG